MMNEFNNWIKSPEGKIFLSMELEKLASIYPMLVGAQGLQVSLSGSHDYLGGANVSERYFVVSASGIDADPVNNVGKDNVNAAYAEAGVLNTVKATNYELPFANNEFGVVAAPHLVETSLDPQAALREIYRVTAREGLVLLTGLNPVSLFGLRSKLPFSKNRLVQTSITVNRLKDWLHLLGFDIVAGNMFQYSGLLPDSSDSTSQKKSDVFIKRIHQSLESMGDRWLPMSAGAYVLVARKRALGGTMVGKANKLKRKARSIVGAKPVVTRIKTDKSG